MWSLSKNLELLLYPIGAIWFLLVVGALYFLKKGRIAGAIYTTSLVLIMFIIGSTTLPAHALASLEKRYVGQTIQTIPNADAIVVLGGMVGTSKNDSFSIDMRDSIDRFVKGVELSRAGKAPVIVLGGSYTGLSAGSPSTEGEALKNWAAAWNVGAREVIFLPHSRDTHDEAVATQKLATERKWQRVLLVTSAFHLRRAEATFKKAGLAVTPVACDFQGHSALESPREAIVPDVFGFDLLRLFIHEKVGWYVYAWRRWL